MSDLIVGIVKVALNTQIEYYKENFDLKRK